MNDLNLRVAALKLCAQPKQYAQLRCALAPIPHKWQISNELFLQSFKEATTVKQQLSAVKEIFGVIGALQFLSDILFHCPIKHLVRCQLVKLFSSTTLDYNKDELIQPMINTLDDLLIDLINPNITLDEMNHMFVSINGCFENFPNGRDALSKRIDRLVPIISDAFHLYWSKIKSNNNATTSDEEELSPTRRNTYYLYIQNLLRFHVTYLVELRESLEAINPIVIQDITTISIAVAKDINSPWDVRSIAGLAIAHNENFLNNFDMHIRHCCAMKAHNEVTIQAAILLLLNCDNYHQANDDEPLRILSRIIEVTSENINASSLLVYMSKHLVMYSKILINISTSLTTTRTDMINKDIIIGILNKLLQFALTNITNSIDSVRHMSSDLLRNVLQLAKVFSHDNGNFAFQIVYDKFEKQSLPLNSSCLMLMQVVAVIGTQTVLDHCPSLLNLIFKKYLGHEDGVNALYKFMMNAAIGSGGAAADDEDNFEKWHQIWGVTLMEAARQNDNRLHGIERLINDAVQLAPEILAKLLDDPMLPLSTKLTALVSVRRQSRKLKNQKSSSYHQYLKEFEMEINEAIIGADDHTRLLALGCIVETSRISEELSENDLLIINTYIRYNINNPNAHMRQKGYALIMKALKRIELALATATAIGQHNKSNNKRDEGEKSNRNENQMVKFLSNFIHFLATSLFPTANYGRRWMALRLLRECVNLCKKFQLSLHEMVNDNGTLVINLENCLGDSYEENKMYALQLLQDVHYLRDSSISKLRIDDILQLLISLRPPDTATAAYQLKYYCQYSKYDDFPSEEAMRVPNYEPTIYAALKYVNIELNNGLKLAESNLSMASKCNPLHGLLFANRHLLQGLDLNEFIGDELWCEYFNSLIAICIRASDVVMPIVGSDSPEGHLPDIHNADVDDDEENNIVNILRYKLYTVENVKTTPQMVLLCGWRTIKEIALILADLTYRASIKLLPINCIIAIGEHFRKLLSEIKHRGAFEQVYVGFTQICRRLWQSEEPALNILPQQWLQEAVDIVCEPSAQPGMWCATRRSAGVPYMLQAIICTELQLGTHETLDRTMCVLLDICKNPHHTHTAARTHALNIMRALFRCSDLAEFVDEHVTMAIICALHCLEAKDWSEQNSATLLFSALIVRIFGVERARDINGELHVRNRMTGRIFFTRYPKLFDHFHQVLKTAVDVMRLESKRPQRQPLQLESLVLLLSRLYPSPLEGAEHSFNITDFVPFLVEICGSIDCMTRERSAFVVAQNINQHQAGQLLRRCLLNNLRLYEELRQSNGLCDSAVSYSKEHGQWLLMLQICKHFNWIDISLMHSILYNLTDIALIIYNHDMFLFNAIIDILNEILAHCEAIGNLCVLKKLYELCDLDHWMIYDLCKKYAISPRFYYLYRLHLNRFQLNTTNNNDEDDANVDWVKLPQPVQELQLDVWLYLIYELIQQQQHDDHDDDDALITSIDIEHLQFANDVVRYCKLLPIQRRRNIAIELRATSQICDDLIIMENAAKITKLHSLWYPQMFAKLQILLGILPNNNFTRNLDTLLKRTECEAAAAAAAETVCDSIQCGYSICILRIISENGLPKADDKLFKRLLNYTLKIASPSQSMYLRYKAAQICGHLMKKCNVSEMVNCTENAEIIGLYIRLGLLLLNDDSSEVRTIISTYVGKLFAIPSKSAMLPCIALTTFVKYVLDALKKCQLSIDILENICTIAVEPFEPTSNQQQQQGGAGGEVELELFDQHETNVYCEAGNVIDEFRNAFTTTFPDTIKNP